VSATTKTNGAPNSCTTRAPAIGSMPSSGIDSGAARRPLPAIPKIVRFLVASRRPAGGNDDNLSVLLIRMSAPSPVVSSSRATISNPDPWRDSGYLQRIFEAGAFCMSTKQFDKIIEQQCILIVDGNPYARKLTRTMLMNVGAKTIMESPDGV